MRIAIFSDDFYENKLLKRSLYTFANYKRIDFVVDVFTDWTKLYNQKDNYILFFVSFNNKTGVKLAKLLNESQEGAIIITASNTNLAVDAYKINAYNFLQSPINENNLFKILENYFARFFEYNLIIKNGFETICVNAKDILYLEANNKHCFLHLKNQTIPCNKTMARVVSVLPENLFLKISRAFVVNSNYIYSFNNECVTLINGATLHPSRHFYKTFKFDYYRTLNAKIP